MDSTPGTMTVRVSSEAQRIAVMAALAMAGEIEAAARSAPVGTILARCEEVAIGQGRELTRRTLEQVLQQSAVEAQKKGRPAEPAAAATVARTRGKASGR